MEIEIGWRLFGVLAFAIFLFFAVVVNRQKKKDGEK